jgi:hypothetical protein
MGGSGVTSLAQLSSDYILDTGMRNPDELTSFVP